jgi:hypothetical protein
MGEPVPPLFWLRDPEGNQLMVVEIPTDPDRASLAAVPRGAA